MIMDAKLRDIILAEVRRRNTRVNVQEIHHDLEKQEYVVEYCNALGGKSKYITVHEDTVKDRLSL